MRPKSWICFWGAFIFTFINETERRRDRINIVLADNKYGFGIVDKAKRVC